MSVRTASRNKATRVVGAGRVFRKPPVFLQPGDVVEIEIEDLGVLRNTVCAED
jgi:2-keto-4-pentenoate hydratase/2-oxohepta-3-ene-1,7-dioic acid hydratase in catechol pathway